ncbi:hypothetical protein [Ralstonia sp.]|uniref:hypothetical protein n=1 Tax=unclassified Ralstonia TaxID=209769 RepID=UPI0031D77743
MLALLDKIFDVCLQVVVLYAAWRFCRHVARQLPDRGPIDGLFRAFSRLGDLLPELRDFDAGNSPGHTHGRQHRRSRR